MRNHTDCDVKTRLEYLNETKNLIMNSINNIGGEITEDTPFSQYPIILENLINNSIIPQSTLNNLISKTEI